MARNVLRELLEKQQRAGRYKTVPSSFDLDALRKVWDDHLRHVHPASELIPIRIVTTLEVFLRHWIAVLIDHGAPYVERASKLTGDRLKFDFAIAQSMQGGSITLGQFIAHNAQLSSFEAVAASLKLLVGDKFFEELGAIKDRWDVETQNESAMPIISDVGAMCKALKNLYDARNILVHEMPAKPPHAVEDVSAFLIYGSQFLAASEEMFLTIVHGNYPVTNYGMQEAAANRRDKASAELKAVCKAVEKASATIELDEVEFASAKVDISDVQAAWELYVEAEANRVTEWELGGTVRPLIYLSAKAELIEARVKELKDWLDGRPSEVAIEG